MLPTVVFSPFIGTNETSAGTSLSGGRHPRSPCHPNENFKFLYPKLWARYNGESRLQPHELHVGLYGLTLSAGWKTGLYPMLQKDLGPLNANAVLDYAMFSIRHRADATDLMKDEMAQQMLFPTRFEATAGIRMSLKIN